MTGDTTADIIIIVVIIILALGAWALIYYRMIGTIIGLIVFTGACIWIGSTFGGIIGVIAFVGGFIPFMKIPFIIDVAHGVFNAHHKRNDERAINHLKGEALMRHLAMKEAIAAGAASHKRKMAEAEAEYQRTGKPIDREELFGNKNK
jgi:hypothetical protein